MEVIRQNGYDDDNLNALQTEVRMLSVPAKEKALLFLAQELTVRPGTASDAVRAATDAGWSNEEAAEAVFLVSQYNMMTRIAGAFALPADKMHPFPDEATMPMLQCGEQPAGVAKE